MTLPVRRQPCSSCPYVAATPGGLWHQDEYLKLPAFDRPTGEQPAALFLCHQSELGEPERLCRGWVQVHRDESLAVRLGMAAGRLDPDEVWADTPGVVYHPSGTAAAVHGLRGLVDLTDAARKAIDRLTAARDRAHR